MKHVQWSAAASRDLEALRTYYDGVGVGVAQPVIDRLILATDWLLEWPYAERKLGQSGWRKWGPRRTGHVLIYRPLEDGLDISRVRGERENWLADL